MLTLRPWHESHQVEDRYDGPPIIHYQGRCQAPGCTRRFQTSDARQQYCDNHHSAAGRVRLHRKSPASNGRKVFAFEVPPHLRSVTVILADASIVELEAQDGSLKTLDAEVAALIPLYLRLLPPSTMPVLRPRVPAATARERWRRLMQRPQAEFPDEG